MVDPNTLTLDELFSQLTADGSLERLARAARDEDLGVAGDVTTAAIECATTRGVVVDIVPREAGVLAGLAAIPAVAAAFDVTVGFEPLARDGEPCSAGVPVGRAHGSLADVVRIERTVLNLLGRLVGVATLTRRFVDAVAGTGACVCDTRKTTPGLRALEKYSVRCGGGTLHRLGLHDAVLLKDNHVAGAGCEGAAAFGSFVAAVATRARAAGDLQFVAVEVDTENQFDALLALEPGLVDIALLDNMDPVRLREAVERRNRLRPGLLLEASGGVSLETVRAIAETGVDRISVGALTHGARSVDLAFDAR